MTADELGAMTLSEIEALAARLGAAAAAMREMRALMGVQASSTPQVIGWVPAIDQPAPVGLAAAMTDEQAIVAHRMRQFQPVEGAVKGSKLTAAEQAEKARLLGRNRTIDENLPDDIRKFEES